MCGKYANTFVVIIFLMLFYFSTAKCTMYRCEQSLRLASFVLSFFFFFSFFSRLFKTNKQKNYFIFLEYHVIIMILLFPGPSCPRPRLTGVMCTGR